MLKKNGVVELWKKLVKQEEFKYSWGTNWTGAPVSLVSDSSLLSKTLLSTYCLEYLSLRVEFLPSTIFWDDYRGSDVAATSCLHGS